MLGSVIEVNLVCADTKASNDNEMLGLSKDLLSELRLRSNPNDVDITTDITLVTYREWAGEIASNRIFSIS
jgi:hypothetical protein